MHFAGSKRRMGGSMWRVDVWYFDYEVRNEQGGSSIGESHSLSTSNPLLSPTFVEPHDCGVRFPRQSALAGQKTIG